MCLIPVYHRNRKVFAKISDGDSLLQLGSKRNDQTVSRIFWQCRFRRGINICGRCSLDPEKQFSCRVAHFIGAAFCMLRPGLGVARSSLSPPSGKVLCTMEKHSNNLSNSWDPSIIPWLFVLVLEVWCECRNHVTQTNDAAKIRHSRP